MELRLDTSQREELVDITAQVARLVAEHCAARGIRDGLVHLHSLHTTAGLICNEAYDPDVARDVLLALSRIVHDDWPYRHAEGNSPAHVKAILTGGGLTLPVRGGELALGRWQGVFFAEFDGPRAGRRVAVTLSAAY